MRKTLLVFAATTALCFAADPFVATWKPAQLDKWKISPGGGQGEASKSLVVTTELIAKDTYRNTITSLDGKAVDGYPPFISLLDGTERPGKNNTTIKLDRIDARHFRTTVSSSKGTVIEDFVVAPDGKTQTIARHGTGTISGRHVDELYIFEKQ